MARGKKTAKSGGARAADYRHSGEKRKNIPPAKIASEGTVPKVERVRYAYNPHLPPVLRFDPTGEADNLSDLVEAAGKRPLNDQEQNLLQSALSAHEPWLEWTGKREQHEKGIFDVDPIALHIHERVSAQACVRAAMREDVQKSLFADPEQPYHQAVQFYQHDIDWANRLILGDSLQVMSSLARREGLAGKVQMVYMDPPYGIGFKSNFQPQISSKDVKDTEKDLTREAETVRAYRDTWTIGLHSYLSYLRDRLVVARGMLTPSGSVFVQIGDANVHLIRAILDEVFGRDNCVSLIQFKKTGGFESKYLPSISDYVLWYAKEISQIKYRPLYLTKTLGDEGAGGRYNSVLLIDGSTSPLGRFTAEQGSFQLPEGARPFLGAPLTSEGSSSSPQAFEFRGRVLIPKTNQHWKTTEQGRRRLDLADRLFATREFVNYRLFLDDFPAVPISNMWTDTMGTAEQDNLFVVPTPPKVIERCVLMATVPGDLVLDPTCGGGTTARVAEQWGRRWIAIDTSRIALALTRQRLLTSKFDMYKLQGPDSDGRKDPSRSFAYQTIPHISLGDVANNVHLDPVFEKFEPILDAALAACNDALGDVTSESHRVLREKLARKQAEEGKRSITEADRRRWDLPREQFERWNLPYDTDTDWPESLRDAVTSYRRAWREKMDAVNECIASNASQEELVDQPEIEKGIVRVSGPFTVEGVLPEELSLGPEGLFDATPNEFQEEETGSDPRLTNLHAYLTKMVQSLRSDGLTFLGNKRVSFARLEPLFESASGSVLHAEGVFEGGETAGPATVAVTFGPQYGPVTAQQVEDAIRSARRFDELVVAGFSFAAEASAVIEESSHPKLRIHAAYIRPDLNPAMDGLLKETPGSQLFTVFGQPDVEVERLEDGEWVVRLGGVEIYDPIANMVRSTGADKVAAWFLDQDFDGRCFCITQAFFPDQDAWEKIAKALGSSADPEAFDAFKGTVSLPFRVGKHNRIAVKVIDPRGNEVMAIKALQD